VTTSQTTSRLQLISYSVEREHHHATWWGIFFGSRPAGYWQARSRLCCRLLQWPRDSLCSTLCRHHVRLFLRLLPLERHLAVVGLAQTLGVGVIGAIIWGALVVNGSILAQPAPRDHRGCSWFGTSVARSRLWHCGPMILSVIPCWELGKPAHSWGGRRAGMVKVGQRCSRS